MVLTDILYQIWERDAAYLIAKGVDCEYRLYVHGEVDWGYSGVFECFKKDKSGWGHPFSVSGEKSYKQLVDKMNGWAGEDLNALDWKPHRPIT